MTKANLKKQKSKSKLQDIFDIGEKSVCKNFIAFFLSSPVQTFSATIIASKKIGNAVIRNRSKRRLRELTRTYIKPNSPINTRLILIARTATHNSKQSLLTKEGNYLVNKILANKNTA